MNDYLRRQHESCVRCDVFLKENSGDFTGEGDVKRLALEAAVIDTEAKNAALLGAKGETSMEFEQKRSAREDLKTAVSEIADMAVGMEPDFDGISDLFRYRRNLPDVDLLALARAFHTDSATYEANFIAYGLPATFRADLDADADAFQAETGDAAVAKAERVGAGDALVAAVEYEMQLKRTLDPIVRITYKGEPGKLAAWASAFAVEAAPKKPTDTP